MLPAQVAVDPFGIVELRVVVVPNPEQYGPMILRDEQRDPTVLALEQVRRRVVLVLATGALHHAPFGGIIERHMLVQRHARLNRSVDPRADAAGLALPERQGYAVGREQARVIVRLGLRRIA